jgi:hypothetical protein
VEDITDGLKEALNNLAQVAYTVGIALKHV